MTLTNPKQTTATGRDTAAIIRELAPDVILKAAALCNGHDIITPGAFTVVGLPTVVVDQLTEEHRSDPRSHKTTLYVDGIPVNSIKGADGLNMLTFLAGSLGLTYPEKLGRGSQANAIRTALHDHFPPDRG